MTGSVPDPRRWKALALLCAAFFMVILDASIVIVALPSIERNLGFAAADLQWVLSGYALSYGGLLLLGGRLADLLGRRRMFIAGTALFALSSLACGVAWSGEALVAARVVQGVSAAIMTPSALSILMTTFEEGSGRNKALGVWGAIGGVGGTAGWLIGGPITDELGWEWLFFINVPIAAALLALSPALLRESRADLARRSFDVGGALTVTGAIALAILGVVEAPDVGWTSSQTLALAACSAGLLALFVAIEGRTGAPLVPRRIFRSRALVGGNLALLALGMVAFGMPFILTQYAQQVLGFSALEFGLSSAVMPVTAALGSVGGQALVTRTGPRPVVAGGMVLAGLGCLVLTQVSATGSYPADILPGLLVFGPGIGLAFVGSSIATLAGVAESEAGLASGLNNTSFQIGAAVGVAILSTVAVSNAKGADPLIALTEGAQAAFGAALAFPLLGLVVALLRLGKLQAPLTAEPLAPAVD
jgi:EmrB/QacA subfamily drug resistance transporter